MHLGKNKEIGQGYKEKGKRVLNRCLKKKR